MIRMLFFGPAMETTVRLTRGRSDPRNDEARTGLSERE
jgi:hypothetical protein